MEPHSETSPSLHLPQPSFGQNSSVPFQGTGVPLSAPSLSNSGMPQHASAQSSDAQSITAATDHDMSPERTQAGDQADDLDKEWIAKAKLIVEQTKNDPYTQSKEMGKVKADYLRIRFNKQTKVNPDKAS